MTDTTSSADPQSDLDLPDLPQPLVEGYDDFIFHTKLALHLSCTRYPLGTWDEYGVRVLTNEAEEYASIHFRVPAALPKEVAEHLATFATQRVRYTERDREWDSMGGPTSDHRYWSGFVDSVIAATNFARAALESAVWSHARGEQWSWGYSPPGRVEAKYELWGDSHPNLYDADAEYEDYLKERAEEEENPVDDPIEW